MPHEPGDTICVRCGAGIQLLIGRALRGQLYFVGGTLEKPHDDLVDSDVFATHASSPLVVSALTPWANDTSLHESRPRMVKSQRSTARYQPRCYAGSRLG